MKRTAPTIEELRKLLARALDVTPSNYLISPALCRFTNPGPAERRVIAQRLHTIIDAHMVQECTALTD